MSEAAPQTPTAAKAGKTLNVDTSPLHATAESLLSPSRAEEQKLESTTTTTFIFTIAKAALAGDASTTQEVAKITNTANTTLGPLGLLRGSSRVMKTAKAIV